MADFSEITINTTAQKIERMANMEINNEAIDDTSDDNSLPTSKLVYDFVSNSASGVNGDYVSYSQSQDLTDEQKETARNNINAVDTTELAGAIIASGLKSVSVVRVQDFTEAEKAQGRENIGAVSQTELDSTIGNINSILATVVSGVSE